MLVNKNKRGTRGSKQKGLRGSSLVHSVSGAVGLNLKSPASNPHVWSFYTTHTGSFAVTLTKAVGQTVVWDFGNGQGAVSNSTTITYADAGKKKVKAYVDDFTLITALNTFNALDFFGVLDLRQFTNCTSMQIFDNGGNVTKILMPKQKSGVTLNNFNIRNYTLIESLDLSMCNSMIYLAANGCTNLKYINFPKSTGWNQLQLGSTSIINLNLSSLTLAGFFELTNNVKLLNIIHGSSGNSITTYTITGCTSLVSHDMSMLTALGGAITMSGNTSLTTVTFPTSAQTTTNIDLSGCNITGTLNLSGFSSVSGYVKIFNNPLLTAVTLPSSSLLIVQFLAFNCNLTGPLNVSSLSNLSTRFEVYGNTLLTSVVMPSNNNTFTRFYAYSCAVTTVNFTSVPKLTEVNGSDILLMDNGMTAAQVNTILIDLDTNATNGFTGRSITINGSNAAPTGLGLTAKTSLQGKGFTVTTN